MTHPDQLMGLSKRKVAVKPTRLPQVPERRNIRDSWFYREGDYLVGELAPLWDSWVKRRIGNVYDYQEIQNGLQEEKQKEQKEEQVKKTTTKKRNTRSNS